MNHGLEKNRDAHICSAENGGHDKKGRKMIQRLT